MKWSIINQRVISGEVYGKYMGTWKRAATFNRTDVFLGLASNPIVFMTFLDENSYRQTTLNHDKKAFRDLRQNDQRNELPELRLFFEINKLLK